MPNSKTFKVLKSIKLKMEKNVYWFYDKMFYNNIMICVDKICKVLVLK